MAPRSQNPEGVMPGLQPEIICHEFLGPGEIVQAKHSMEPLGLQTL